MPRDPSRIPIVLDVIAKAWKAHSDWRLGQLIENDMRDYSHRDLFSIEDDYLVQAIERAFGKSSDTKVPLFIHP